MEASDIVYNYIEFFFSKDDLKSMMTIKPLSYENWLDSLYELYSTKPAKGKFHYNLMHTDEFEFIQKKINEIKEKEKNANGLELSQTEKADIMRLFKEIEDKYAVLDYYDDIYVYAHYVFNTIRKSGIPLMGGGLSLDEFKNKIREKIRLMDL